MQITVKYLTLEKANYGETKSFDICQSVHEEHFPIKGDILFQINVEVAFVFIIEVTGFV